MWVILYHQIPHEDPGPAVSWMGGLPLSLHLILRCGYAAVTVFFVLSGFVLAYNYDLGAAWSAGTRLRFWIARFARIYPAYVSGLVLIAPFVLYRVLLLDSGPPAGWELLTAALNALLLQAWAPETALTWNYPGWSLSDEAFFYAVFPFIGVWLWRLRGVGAWLGAAAALWVISMLPPLITIALPVHGFGDIPADHFAIPDAAFYPANLIRYNPLLRLAEFAAGIVVARLYRHSQTAGNPLDGRGYWLYLPGLAVAGLVLAQAGSIPYPLAHNGLLLPPYACLILGLAFAGGPVARWMAWKPLVYLGNASYSMYILHVPVQAWLQVPARRLLGWEPRGLTWILLYSAAVILLSCLFFHFIEEPAHRRLRGYLQRRLLPAAGTPGGQTGSRPDR